MENEHKMSKKSKKGLKIIIFSAIGIFLISMFFNKYFGDSTIMSIRMKLFQKRIERQEQKYINDKYGGKTPEETYQMFLDALKKKDIELASKYFVLGDREKYKKALEEIDQKNKGEAMMEDLTQKNLKGEKIGDTVSVLEIFNDKGEFLTQIGFLLPTKTFDKSSILSSFWKIYSF